MSTLPLPMTDESLMPFGKHRGKAMSNVPARYLLWLWENAYNLRNPLKDYIATNLDAIKKEVELSDKRKKQKRSAG